MIGNVVLLGDACTGKSSLVRCLKGEPFSPTYEATVGTDMSSVELHCKHGAASVTLWDYSGNERFLSTGNIAMLHADVCVLVVDASAGESFEHLTQWHDEYLQSGFQGEAPPALIIALTKIDVEKRRVLFEEVIGWSSQEHHDPTLWPQEATGTLLPAPPVIEICCEDNRGVPTLATSIAERLFLRDKLKKALSTPVPQFCSFAGASGIRVAVFGDAERAKDILISPSSQLDAETCPAVEQFERESPAYGEVDTGSAKLNVWLSPTTTTTSAMTFCRGAQVCLFALKLGIHPMVQRIGFWKEIFLRESGLRDLDSVFFVVVGCRTSDYVPDSSVEAATYCAKSGCHFVELPEVPSSEYVARCWGQIAESALEQRGELILSRTTKQLASFHAEYALRFEREKQQEEEQQVAPALDESVHLMARRPSSMNNNQRLDIIDTSINAVNNRILSSESELLKMLKQQEAEYEKKIADLNSSLATANARIDAQNETIGDMKLEMRLLWEAIEQKPSNN